MADTRCANPEYQLEVDTMVVEYTLYKAIESTIELVRLQIDGLKPRVGTSSSVAAVYDEDFVAKYDSTMRLQDNLSTLLALLRLNHPRVPRSTAVWFNIEILGFLKSLSYYIHQNFYIPEKSNTTKSKRDRDLDAMTDDSEESDLSHNDSIPAASDDKSGPFSNIIVGHLRDKRDFDAIFRWHWDEIRQQLYYTSRAEKQKDARKVNGDANMSESPELMFHADYPPRSLAALLQRGPLMLDDLMFRFMYLSAEISGVLGDINVSWMELAADFMFHSALERLMAIEEFIDSRPLYELRRVKDWDVTCYLGQCFSWGSFHALDTAKSLERLEEGLDFYQLGHWSDLLPERLEKEVLISNMFDAKIDTTGVEKNILKSPNIGRSENIQQREDYIKILGQRSGLIHHASNSIYPHKERSISKLVRSYPLPEFLYSLVHYMDEIWRCHMSSNISGKPVLIDIEEGRIPEGYGSGEKKEFDDFLARCGLKSRQVNSESNMNGSSSSRTEASTTIQWTK